MAQLTQQAEPSFHAGKKSNNIKIDVKCDYALTKEAHLKILEALLKYILYQCRQIPVQIEVLLRDNQNWPSNSCSEEDRPTCITNICKPLKPSAHFNVASSLSSREEIKEMIIQRKNEKRIRNYEKKRKRWLPKVNNVLTCYKSYITLLQEQLDKSIVSAVIFAIGSSPALANVIFKVNVQSNIPVSMQQHRNKKRNSNFSMGSNSNTEAFERKVLLGLFRAFSSNEELSKLINGNFSTKKVWLLLEKQEFTENFDESEVALQNDNFLIPCIHFEIPRRAKVVDIILNETYNYCNNDIVDMELTPCVDSKLLSFHNNNSALGNIIERKRIKVSLFPNLYNNVKSPFCDNLGCEKLCSDGNNSKLEEKCETSQNHLESKIMKNETFRHPFEKQTESMHAITLCPSPCSDKFIDTPVISKAESTPSPIKLLSKNVNSLNFGENYPKYSKFIWYQYQTCIQGFKDLFLHQS